MLDNIRWLGHDTFKIVGAGKIIYLDPFQLPRTAEPADIILITHEHHDHCSPADVEKIRTPQTIVIANASAAEQLAGNVRVMQPDEQTEIEGVNIKAVRAYNVNKFREANMPFHPRDEGKLGYIITVEGQRIYHAGDTDCIPEMAGYSTDVALLPVSGTYVMTAEEAAEAVRLIKPKIAIPMHYGTIVGSAEDAESFRRLVGDLCQVVILEKVE